MKKIVLTSLISLFISLPAFADTSYYNTSYYHHRHRIVCKTKHVHKKNYVARRHVRPIYRMPVAKCRTHYRPSYAPVPMEHRRKVTHVVRHPIPMMVPINPMPVVPTHEYRAPCTSWSCNPCQMIYIGAYGGYGIIRGAYSNDGDFAQGRLALGVHGPVFKGALGLGAELGVQSGNDMRLDADPGMVAVIGGPIQSTLKPFADALVTLRFQGPNNPFFGFIKGGVAYRQLQLNNITSPRGDTVRKLNAEAQGGIGFNISSHAAITLFYQGIYAGSDAGLTINNAGNIMISRIPTQQAGFLGMEFSL